MLSRDRYKAFSYAKANEHVLKVILPLTIVFHSVLSDAIGFSLYIRSFIGTNCYF